MSRARVVVAPLDPVHDVGVKLIARALSDRGHEVTLLPPDLTPEEVVSRAVQAAPDFVMVGRTLSYGAAEVLSRFVDLSDSSGLRKRAKLVLGGLSVRPEMAQELGFDAGFGPDTTPSQVADYVEGKTGTSERRAPDKPKPDLTSGYTYAFRDREIGDRCTEAAKLLLRWAESRTSPGVERADLRLRMADLSERGEAAEAEGLRRRYVALTGGDVRRWYETGVPVPGTRPLNEEESLDLSNLAGKTAPEIPASQEVLRRWNVLVQYGTGCPVMDAYHIGVSLGWGASGVIHFDPSWGAREEGLLEGSWSHQHDGTVITLENLRLLSSVLCPGILWQVRAHRGLNTPETVALAHLAGADLTKINIVYGSLGAGTDPARLAVDGVHAASWGAGRSFSPCSRTLPKPW